MKPLIDADERWLDVVDYEGLYQVSDLGRVRSLERQVFCNNPRTGGHIVNYPTKVLKPNLNFQGYCRVNLFKNKCCKMHLIHRLVAKAFLPEEKEEVNHKDGDKANNLLLNLEWTTPKENSTHSCLLHRRGFRRIDSNPRNQSLRPQV